LGSAGLMDAPPAGYKGNTDETTNNGKAEVRSNGSVENHDDSDDEQLDGNLEDEEIETLLLKPGRRIMIPSSQLDKEALKRTLFVIPATMIGYWASEFLSMWLVLKYAPKQVVWARRTVETLHSVVACINGTRGVMTGGKASKYDIVWAMELGYYFYEIRKVSGSDLTHHIVSIWAHGGLLLDALYNRDKPSGERRTFYHGFIMMCLHFAEPWKDIARAIPNERLRNFVWVFHHLAYVVRVAFWPLLVAINLKTPLNKYHLLNAPWQCSVASSIFFLLNCYWLYLKLKRFSWPHE